MLGKVIGAMAGERIAREISGVSGTGGALLGVAAATVLRRIGPVGLVALAATGYVLKKHRERRHPSAPMAPGAAL